MEVFPEDRRARLSVGELAGFQLRPSVFDRTRGGRWRTELGQHWHNELAEQTAQTSPDARFEVPIKATALADHWRIELQGRIDQILESSNTLREVKSIRQGLPADPDELRASYASYFNQAAIYAVLSGLDPAFENRDWQSEVQFVDIDEGLTQAVPLSPEEARQRFDAQIAVLLEFLKTRRDALRRLHTLEPRPPFPQWREGQPEAREGLCKAAERDALLLFQAPTGFGKTGLVLEWALERMKNGLADRLIYLTGKSTGQLQVVRQLEGMAPPESGLRYHQMRNRTEHAINTERHTCDAFGGCRRDIDTAWEQSGLSAPTLLANGPLPLEALHQLGAETGVCPFEISRVALPFADVWIGDYNYVFHPRARSVFMERPGFDPARTLLIVDEAHNLPGRVAGAYTFALDRTALLDVLTELQFSSTPRELTDAWEALAEAVADIRKSPRLDPDDEALLNAALREVTDVLPYCAIDPEQLSAQAWELLWSTLDIRATLEKAGLEILLWAPARGRVIVDCLSAAPEIAASLQPFAQTVLMSATLEPLDAFREACGLPETSGQFLLGEAPWRDAAYRVGLDLRIDTRMRARANSQPRTAETIARLCEDSPEPVAVFFSSYKYANDVAAHLDQCAPGLRVALQPRATSLGEQNEWVEESLLTAHALFLVLGTGFSEGIDLLGGRINRAMVVGPALPEVNAAQDHRMETRSHLGRTEAFRLVYQIPGLIKINQALGRLVRAPGQHASILLHGKRFGDPTYRNLLAPEYQSATPITEDEDLNLWLREETEST